MHRLTIIAFIILSSLWNSNVSFAYPTQSLQIKNTRNLKNVVLNSDVACSFSLIQSFSSSTSNTCNMNTNALYASSFPEHERQNVNRFFERLDDAYTHSNKKIKCPFFRRRAADLIDSIAMIVRFLLIRHKTLIGLVNSDLVMDMEDYSTFAGSMIPPGCRAFHGGAQISSLSSSSLSKSVGLPLDEIISIIHKDWTRLQIRMPSSSSSSSLLSEIDDPKYIHDKGYYITGMLNSTIYRDDCVFDGPDPDMPVQGLRKYLSAASKLFDDKQSYADLLDLRIISTMDNQKKDDSLLGRSISNNWKSGNMYTSDANANVNANVNANANANANDPKSISRKIQATWRISGVIMLPWKPVVKPYTGKTIYHIDKDGLIYFHEEKWDISVWEAFIHVLFPEIGEKIWGSRSGTVST